MPAGEQSWQMVGQSVTEAMMGAAEERLTREVVLKTQTVRSLTRTARQSLREEPRVALFLRPPQQVEAMVSRLRELGASNPLQPTLGQVREMQRQGEMLAQVARAALEFPIQIQDRRPAHM